MFCGIVECIGKVVSVEREQGSVRFRIISPLAGRLQAGQSVAHDGVCLTVTNTGPDWHEVIVTTETLRRSNLGLKSAGDAVNLERSLTLQSFVDGHLVLGHVDVVARCLKIRQEGNSKWLTFGVPKKKFAPLLVEKGSVCLNGVSLTVSDCSTKKFSVVIIPYTLEHTTFQWIKEGELVNVEFDIIGKYLVRFAERYSKMDKNK
ncbi:MAG: riboflavin synthase [Chitinophagales bacterium]|nr:riboflavin synthase [Chitinophagales bacterium]MDW8428515.1 riboflavin synthase [Chitinophagales bacterium]